MLRGECLEVFQHLIERARIAAQVFRKHPDAGDQLRNHGNQQNGDKQNNSGKCNDDTQTSCHSAVLHLNENFGLEELYQRIQNIGDHETQKHRIYDMIKTPEGIQQNAKMRKE